MLLDKKIVTLLEGQTSLGSDGDELQHQLIKILECGEQSGLEMDTAMAFYKKWQKQSPKQ